MPYKCIHGGITRPCTYDPQHDKNLSEEGKKNREKKYRSAKKGDILDYVCPISRKYFVPVGIPGLDKSVSEQIRETQEQDARDLQEISAKLKAFGIKVPKDATVWEAAINLSKLEQVERKKKERKPTRIFERQDAPTTSKDDPKKEPKPSDHKEVGIQKQELRKWLRDHNVKHTNFDDLPKLQRLKKNKQAELDKEE
jgi:hypothetical protein